MESHVATALIGQNFRRTCGIDDPIDSDEEQLHHHSVFDLDDALADLFEAGNDGHHRIRTPDNEQKAKKKQKTVSKTWLNSFEEYRNKGNTVYQVFSNHTNSRFYIFHSHLNFVHTYHVRK